MGNREHIYEIIAGNIRKERKRFGMTQAELAERADISLDTIKSVENGRRAMSLDTYLNIVHALESSPIGCKGEYRAVQIVRYYHVVYQNRVNADAYHNEEALKTDSEQGF